MTQFKTLEEFINYIPKCVICSKSMQLYIDGRLSSVSGNKPRWNSGRMRLRVKLDLEESILISRHKQYKIGINPTTNQVVEGLEFVNRLNEDMIFANKSCPTCDFKVTAAYLRNPDPKATANQWQKFNSDFGQVHEKDCFPPLALREEQVHYTLKGGIDVKIMKNYSWPDPTNVQANILLNHKYLPPAPFDFNKFQDMEHLNKRIATIKLFH